MMSAIESTEVSKGALWTGRVISVLVTLMFLLDGVMKLVKPAPVVESAIKLGYDPQSMFGIGILLLVCTALYAIPRTSVLGAILLTGYLGGAVATHVRAGSSAFETVFPAIFGALAWGGLYLRTPVLRSQLPWRRN